MGVLCGIHFTTTCCLPLWVARLESIVLSLLYILRQESFLLGLYFPVSCSKLSLLPFRNQEKCCHSFLANCFEGRCYSLIKPFRDDKIRHSQFLMVSVEDASAVEPAKIHCITNVNNFSQTTTLLLDGDNSTRAECSISTSSISDTKESSKPFLSLEGVCQTTGFINSQNQQVAKFPSNVRFVVQPVAEDNISKANGESDEEDKHHNLSAHSFTFPGANASADDINGHYSKLIFIKFSSIFCLICWWIYFSDYWGSDPHAQLTVRSMASIGLGSSNGRKIHMRRVHTTGADLVSPLLISPNGETIQTPWTFPTITYVSFQQYWPFLSLVVFTSWF